MTTTQFTRLPEGITTMPPGPELGALLASVDVSSVEPAGVPLYLVAEQRQSNHQCARRLLALRECALADLAAPGGRRDVLDQYAAEEPRAALSISGVAAWRDLTFVDALTTRVPRVLAAMLAGDVDERRARAFVEYTEHLSPAHTDKLVDLLLDGAGRVTVAELRHRLDRTARALDPEWAARREQRRVRQQRLRAYLNGSGAATISLLDVPVAVAFERVSGVADLAAMCQAAGHPGLLDRVHSDVALALMDWGLRCLSVEDFVDTIVAHAHDRAARETAEDAAAATHNAAEAAEQAAEQGRHNRPTDPAGPADDDGAGGDRNDVDDFFRNLNDDLDDLFNGDGENPADSDDPADSDGDDPSDGDGARGSGSSDEPTGGGGDRPDGDEPGGDGPSGDGSGGAGAQGKRPRGATRGQLRIKIALTTVMGLDEQPATLEGWGAISPVSARQLIWHHIRARWDIAVAGPDGALVAVLGTRRRPTDHPRRPDLGAPTDRGVITLAVPDTVLDALDPAEHAEWARIITDLQAQLADWRQARHDDELAAHAEATATAAEAAAEAAAQDAAHDAAARSGAEDGPDGAAGGAGLMPVGGRPVGGRPVPVGGLTGFRETPELAAALRRVADRRRRIAWESLQRFPTAALARWIQHRDQTCTFPPCRTPAWLCDLDHTLDWAHHGLTLDSNLGPGCSHDHAAKHLGGWTVHQTKPGHFIWTSRTGNHYPSTPKPVLPQLPDPDPPPDGQRSSTEPDEYAADAPIWDNNPYPGPPPPRRPRGRAPDGADDERPPRCPPHIARHFGKTIADDTGPRPTPVDDEYNGPPPF